jgi:hypothetical protein
MPSIIAELGHVIEKHLIMIGLIGAPKLDAGQQQLIAEKRAEYEESRKQKDAFSKSTYPEGAQMCGKCNTVALVLLDGCRTCLACGDSKCG